MQLAVQALCLQQGAWRCAGHLPRRGRGRRLLHAGSWCPSPSAWSQALSLISCAVDLGCMIRISPALLSLVVNFSHHRSVLGCRPLCFDKLQGLRPTCRCLRHTRASPWTFPGSALGFAFRAVPSVPSGLLPPCSLLRGLHLQRRSRLVAMVVGRPTFHACCSASHACSSCVGVFGWSAFCPDVSIPVPAAAVHGGPFHVAWSRPATSSSEPSLSTKHFWHAW